MDSAVTTLLSRLETVTARLEAVEKQLASGGGAPASSRGASSSGSTGGADSAAVTAYENLINQFVAPYVDLSGKVGAPEVAEQAKLFNDAVQAQLGMLRIAAQSKKPAADVLQRLVKPTADLMNSVTTLREKNRSSKAFNHLSTVSEGIPALGWVLVAPAPAPHVGEMRSSSEFYSNKILKDFKGKEQVHVDWVNAFNTFLKELQAFVKQYHTTGLEWNAKGGDASSASASAPAPSAGGPPPPPTGAPAPDAAPTKSARPAADAGALFAAISKGGDVTKGLNKVTKDMKTSARPESERSSVVKAAEPKVSTTAARGAKENTKPPRMALDGSKWIVEWQKDARDLVISDTESKQTLYVYKCQNTTVQVKGKINAITLDNCSRTSVVFESLVATLDVVNCNSVEVQVTGRVPSISVDKTSGCQLYIGKDALDTEIFTSKSDSMNILIPGAKPEDDLVEIAVPEQFRTSIKGGKLITEANTHV